MPLVNPPKSVVQMLPQRSLPATALALAVLLAAPASAAPIAMEPLVSQALARSPALRSALKTVESQRALETAARAAYWPQLDAGAGLQETTSISPAQTSVQPFTLGNLSLNASQTLLTFGKRAASVEQAEAATAQALAQARLTAAEVAYAARQSYLTWAQAEGLAATAALQIGYAEATLKDAEARFKAGVAPKLDVTRARTAVSRARATLATAKAQTAVSRRRLAAALGQNAPVDGEPLFPGLQAPAARDWEAEAADHPALAALTAQAERALAAAAAAERAGLPDLAANASVGYRTRDWAGQPNGFVGLNLGWPLFTGFAISARAEAARASAEAARLSLEARRLEIRASAEAAAQTLKGVQETLPAVKAALEAARANLVQAQGRYRGGVGTILEVADAQSLLASAQDDDVRATTAYHLALADLQRALGETGVPDAL